MTEASTALPYLLDTNILLALVRGKDLGTFIDTTSTNCGSCLSGHWCAWSPLERS